jgi:hypothetical protein
MSGTEKKQHILLLPQRASLQRAGKAADLIDVVGNFLNFALAHCVVVKY